MAILRHPLQTSFSFFQALRPAYRYDPQLVHAIVTRKPDEIVLRLENFRDSENSTKPALNHGLTLNQLNHLAQHVQELLDKPLELAIALHGIEETTEENSYFCIRALVLNFEKLITHAAYFEYAAPNLENILKKAAENKDHYLLDFIVATFAENKNNPEFYEKSKEISENLDAASQIKIQI